MKFRKKPVVVDAWQLSQAAYDHLPLYGNGNGVFKQLNGYVLIETLEGTMRADIGDWIITGVDGEFYPCKPDIFEKTYEAI